MVAPLVPPSDRPCALVVRHGLTHWNAEQRWQGSADIELHPDGLDQARRAAVTLKGLHVDRVISSQLIRARQTAEQLATCLTITQPMLFTDDRLAERDIGEWSGLFTHEIESRWPGRLDAWRRGKAVVPGGEDESAFAERILAGMRSSLESVRAQTISVAVIVTHGGVMRTLDRLTAASERPVRNLDARWYSLAADGSLAAGDVVSLVDHPTSRTSGGSNATSL